MRAGAHSRIRFCNLAIERSSFGTCQAVPTEVQISSVASDTSIPT